jgi:hypothetical protein
MTEATAVDRPRGTRREDAVLSLDASVAVGVRRLLRGVSYHLGRATLVGNAAPVIVDMRERMRHPKPGDLVVEQSRRQVDDDTAVKSVGILVEHRREHFGEGDEAWSEDAWYVQYGPEPEDVCRWVNADFAAIPWPDERF